MAPLTLQGPIEKLNPLVDTSFIPVALRDQIY